MKKPGLTLLRKTQVSVSSCPNPEPVQPTPANESAHRLSTKASLLVETFLRWTDTNEPLVPFQAAVRILLASALYQTHDPIRLQHLTGLPLPFLTKAVTILLSSSIWLGPDGLVTLAFKLSEAPHDENEIDGLLGELGNQIFKGDAYHSMCEIWSASNRTSSAI